MTPDQALAQVRDLVGRVGQPIAIRRYSGPAGPNRPYTDTMTKAYARAYASQELIGSIIQGDVQVIFLIDTLAAILPVVTTDKIVIRGREYVIRNPLERVVRGVLIAYDIQVRG